MWGASYSHVARLRHVIPSNVCAHIRCGSRVRHGLNRCRYKGQDGMKRWVGLGVISDNLINIGRAINEKSSN
jgi:hypothetical protein